MIGEDDEAMPFVKDVLARGFSSATFVYAPLGEKPILVSASLAPEEEACAAFEIRRDGIKPEYGNHDMRGVYSIDDALSECCQGVYGRGHEPDRDRIYLISDKGGGAFSYTIDGLATELGFSADSLWRDISVALAQAEEASFDWKAQLGEGESWVRTFDSSNMLQVSRIDDGGSAARDAFEVALVPTSGSFDAKVLGDLHRRECPTDGDLLASADKLAESRLRYEISQSLASRVSHLYSPVKMSYHEALHILESPALTGLLVYDSAFHDPRLLKCAAEARSLRRSVADYLEMRDRRNSIDKAAPVR